MRTSSLKLIAGLMFCLPAVAALAQSPSPDTAAAARELIVTMRTADQFKAILPMVVNGLKPAMVQNRPQVEKDYDAIMPILVDAMGARVNEFVDQIADVYAKNFTAAELRDVTAFYRGPTGQKFLQKVPAITQESMLIGQKFGQTVATEMQSRITEELRKRGHKM